MNIQDRKKANAYWLSEMKKSKEAKTEFRPPDGLLILFILLTGSGMPVSACKVL